MERLGDSFASRKDASAAATIVISSLVALRNLSAFSAQLAVSLEPVYAVVLAMLLPIFELNQLVK